MRYESVKTWWCKIYISGPIQVIEQICREECLAVGLCVTVESTKFIYTGGEETGAVVGLINYPRFKSSPEEIMAKAETLARKLLSATFQQSVLVMNPEDTIWMSNRKENE